MLSHRTRAAEGPVPDSSSGWCQGRPEPDSRLLLFSRSAMSDSSVTPVDCSSVGSSVHGVSQARTLEWVAISFSRGASRPRIEPTSPALQPDSWPLSHLGSPHVVRCLVAWSCPTCWDPTPGPSVHGDAPSRTLEWVAVLSSSDLPNPGIEPRSPALQADYLPSEPPGKPLDSRQNRLYSGLLQSEKRDLGIEMDSTSNTA